MTTREKTTLTLAILAALISALASCQPTDNGLTAKAAARRTALEEATDMLNK